MKMIIVAGTPGAGKTSVLVHIIKHLQSRDIHPSVVKIDCIYSEDAERFKKLGVPALLGLSKDMCPDHYSIYNTWEMLEFAEKNRSEMLILETAGLCHRCAPYTQNCLGVCVIDSTSGPNTPRKVGPFLSSADVVAITKGDIISQAEREIFRERILEMNPTCSVTEVNGLTGYGSYELADHFLSATDGSFDNDTLRHTAPFSVCTLCVGEMRVNRKYHRGLLRKINGIQEYTGE